MTWYYGTWPKSRLNIGVEQTKRWLHFNEGGRFFTLSIMHGLYLCHGLTTFRLFRVFVQLWPLPIAVVLCWTGGVPSLRVRRLG